MATKTAHEPLNVRQAILDKIAEKDLTWVAAYKELGISRQTLYAWCGPHSSVPPSPKYATQIAHFIDRPVIDVLEELLRLEAAQHFDGGYDIEVKLHRRGGSVPAGSDGSYSGVAHMLYLAWPRSHHEPRLGDVDLMPHLEMGVAV